MHNLTGYATKSLSESRITPNQRYECRLGIPRITRIFSDFKSFFVLMCFSLYRVGWFFQDWKGTTWKGFFVRIADLRGFHGFRQINGMNAIWAFPAFSRILRFFLF